MKKDDIFEMEVSLEELEDTLQIRKSRIYELIKEGWLPKARKGRFNYAKCVQRYLCYLREEIIIKHVEHKYER